MKSAVVLAAGSGSKLWPFAVMRPKCMVPVSGRPLVDYSVAALLALGFDNIIIAGGRFAAEFRHFYFGCEKVTVLEENSPGGTAMSLLLAREYIGRGSFPVLYGDTVVSQEDIAKLADAGADAALLCPIQGRSEDVVGCCVEDGLVSGITGHAREGGTGYFFCGFCLDESVFPLLAANAGRFSEIEVGMMPPLEAYLEMTLADKIAGGGAVAAVAAEGPVFDVDRPWDILTANEHLNRAACAELAENQLAEGAFIDPTADLRGFVRLGKNSRIGRNVLVEGNVIVGDGTVVENGAILRGNNVIGNDCELRNYCLLEKDSTLGDRCVMNHCAEMWGVAFKGAYLYHYMEFYGVLGESVDLGAATVCGTLRFDDGVTAHRVKTRRELPVRYGDACFVGDYSRTGVNTTLMPGTKIGAYCVVGAGVVLHRDVQDNTLVYAEQNLLEKPWGPEKYGW